MKFDFNKPIDIITCKCYHNSVNNKIEFHLLKLRGLGMKVAEIVVRILEDEGITDAFGIPGAGINPVYKYLDMSTKIKHYTVRH